jgi:hypothetical protein
VALGFGELDGIVMLDDSAQGLVEAESSYSRIPGLVLSTHSRAVPNVVGMGQCKAECNRQPLCKSYSFNAKTNGCLWSSDNLKYDPEFVFALKPTEGDGNYEEIPGMTYHHKGWLRTTGTTKAGCEDLCNKGNNCRAYSFRARDNMCMLTGKDIGVNMEWDYYERTGVANSEDGFPIKGADESNTVATPNLGAKIKEEKALLAQEKQEVAQTKAQVDAIKKKAELQKQALGDKTQEEALLKQKLEQVKAWTASELQHQEEEGKIKVQAAEVKGKADAIKKQNQEAEAKAEKSREEEDADAKRKADASIAQAEQKAKLQREEQTVAHEKTRAQEAISEAAKAKADAERKIEADKEKIADIQKASEKKDEEYRTQLAAQKEKANEKDEKLSASQKAVLDKAEADKKEAVADAKRKVIAQMESKAETELRDVAESQSKANHKESNEKDLERTRAKNRAAEITHLKSTLAAARAKSLELQKEIASAKTDQVIAVRKADIEKMKLEHESSNKLAIVKLDATKKEQESAMKIEEVSRSSRERTRKTERSKAMQMAAAKEGAQKSAMNSKADDDALAVAKAGLAKVKEVGQKASSMPEAQGNELVEKAKVGYRHSVEMAQEASGKQTKYSKMAGASEAATVEAPAMETLLEVGEGVAPHVAELAKVVWPLERPMGGTASDMPGTSQEDYELAESHAAKVRGYMSAEDGDKVKVSYIKFPVEKLEEGEILHGASLSLNKISGPQSPASISMTGCDYKKDDLTFETRPPAVAALSTGQMYPAANGLTNIPLDASIVAQYLNEGEVCLEIGGGGTDTPVLYDSPQIKLDVIKPPPTVDAAPIPLDVNVTVSRRRRSAVPLEPKTTQTDRVMAEAKEIKKTALEKLEPKIQHEVSVRLSEEVEKKKEDIKSAMVAANDKVMQMKIEMINGDPVVTDRITNEELEKQNELLQEDIDAKTPGLIRSKKEALKTELEARLKSSIKKQQEGFMAARIAKALPEEMKAGLAALKHEKLETFQKAPVDPAKMAEAIKPELDQYMAKLDLNAVAAQFAKHEIAKLATAKATTKTAIEIDAEVEKRATAEANNKIQAELNKRYQVALDGTYQSLLESKIAMGGDQANVLKGDSAASKQAKAQLLAEAKQNFPQGTWEGSNKDRILKALVTKESDAIRDATEKELMDKNVKEASAALTQSESATLAKEYIDKTKPIKKAHEKAILEKKYTAEHKAKEVKAAEESGSLVSEAELAELKRVTKAKMEELEQEKTDEQIEKVYEHKLASKEFLDDAEEQYAAIPAQVRASLRKELRPVYMASAAASAKQKIATEKRIAVEKLRVNMDKELQEKILAATTTATVEKIVRPVLEKRVRNELVAQMRADTAEKLTEEGVNQKLAEGIRADYMEGTLKAAEAWVKEHKQEEIDAHVQAEFEKRAEREASIAVANKVAAKKAEMLEEIQQKITNDGWDAREEKIEAAIQGLDEEDADKARDAMMEAAEKKNAAAAKAQLEKEFPAVKAEMMKEVVASELEKLAPDMEARKHEVLDQRAKDIAERAIQRKIRDETTMADEVKPEFVPDPNAPPQVEVEQAMVQKVVGDDQY